MSDEDVDSSGPTPEQWKEVRALLREGLLSNHIPVESTEMRPKVVWQKYMDEANPAIQCIDYDDKSIRDKYTRILRDVRKKHKNGDLENENKPKLIKWIKSLAKQVLKKAFRAEHISPTYTDAKQVWNDHCKDHPAFKNMKYDDAFERRLGTVRDDYLKKLERSKIDQKAYTIAKENHPTPALNSRGEPQWNGSEAQRLLKELVAAGGQINKEPKVLWASQAEYKVYTLKTFRDHIYQEQRLLKFERYLEQLKQTKLDKLQS